VLTANDRESARQLAHKLAGSLGLFGFEWASLTCKEIENSVLTADLSVMADMTEKLTWHLNHVDVRPMPPADAVVDYSI